MLRRAREGSMVTGASPPTAYMARGLAGISSSASPRGPSSSCSIRLRRSRLTVVDNTPAIKTIPSDHLSASCRLPRAGGSPQGGGRAFRFLLSGEGKSESLHGTRENRAEDSDQSSRRQRWSLDLLRHEVLA